MSVPFLPAQQQQMYQMSMPMLYQRAMGQVPMMGGGGMGMMNMNPMMMGMNGYNPMGGMGMMGLGGMNAMNGMNMAGMRMGMNPMGGVGMGANGMGGGAGMGAVGGMTGMGMARPGMGAVNPNFVRGGLNAGGTGPARTTNRGQHSFHPYAR
jgi:RNA-binding protein Musashi